MVCKLPTIGIALEGFSESYNDPVYFGRLLELVLIRCGPAWHSFQTATYATTVCGMCTKRLALGEGVLPQIVIVGSCITQCWGVQKDYPNLEEPTVFCATWTLACTQNCLKNLGFRTVKNHSLGDCCLGTGCDGPHSYRPLDTCRLSRDSHTQLCRCSRRCLQPVPKQNPTATSAFQGVCPQPHLPGSVPNPKALHYVYRASCGYKVRSNLSWSLISSFQSDWSVGFQLRSTLQ